MEFLLIEILSRLSMYKRDKCEVERVGKRGGILPALFPTPHMLVPGAFLKNLQEAEFEKYCSKSCGPGKYYIPNTMI